VDPARRTLQPVPLRPALAVLVLVLLARVARVSWHHRELTLAIWRAVRWRHVLGASVLLALVGGVATALVATVPGAHLGLGDLFGTEANAIFAPLEEGLARAGPMAPTGPDWPLALGASAFLLPLAALLPWLAYVEEELFRAGLEDASWLRVVVASVVFGLVHLVMLVPIGAGIAISVAGFAYTLAYRRGHGAGPTAVPSVALRSFRATRRSRSAADRSRSRSAGHGVVGDLSVLDRAPERAQAAGVFSATVWHTTFNTLVVLTVWSAMVVTALR
jgi:hypothetical protein